MGTFIEIQVGFEELAPSSFKEHWEIAIGAAFREMERVEYLMSVYEPRSDISILNQSVTKGHHPSVQIHPWTYEVIQMAKYLFDLTNGAFDCGIRNAFTRWGIDPPLQNMADYLNQYSIQNIELENDFKVRIHQPVLIDLGGIAKGYAVDRAMAVLTSFGIQHAIVNAGGDLRILGRIPRKIVLRYLGKNTEFITFGRLTNTSIATSSSMVRVGSDIHQSNHLINPHQQKVIFSENLFTVVAPQCMVADALTKALAVDQDPHANYFAKMGATAYLIQRDHLANSMVSQSANETVNVTVNETVNENVHATTKTPRSPSSLSFESFGVMPVD